MDVFVVSRQGCLCHRMRRTFPRCRSFRFAHHAHVQFHLILRAYFIFLHWGYQEMHQESCIMMWCFVNDHLQLFINLSLSSSFASLVTAYTCIIVVLICLDHNLAVIILLFCYYSVTDWFWCLFCHDNGDAITVVVVVSNRVNDGLSALCVYLALSCQSTFTNSQNI